MPSLNLASRAVVNGGRYSLNPESGELARLGEQDASGTADALEIPPPKKPRRRRQSLTSPKEANPSGIHAPCASHPRSLIRLHR